MSAEASVVKLYRFGCFSSVEEESKIRHDLARAEKILNEDHFGLEEVKDRIIEYLAVQKRKKVERPGIMLGGRWWARLHW